MKVESNILNNYYQIFSEARGIAIHKKKIIKTGKKWGLDYLEECLLLMLCLLLLGTFFYKYSLFSLICFTTLIIYTIIVFFNVLSIFLFRYRLNFKHTLYFNKNGLSYMSIYDIKLSIDWDKITGIVFGKHAIVFLTDTPIYFYVNKDIQDDILKILKKYDLENKIIML